MRRVFNAGIPGDTTRELLARFQRDVAMRAPDLVILWAGVNDRLYPGHTVEPAEFRANYAELLDRIRVIGAKVLIGTLPPQYKPYLFTQFPPIAEFPETPEERLAPVDEVPESYLRNLSNSGVPDGLHLTPEGAGAVARCADDAIRQYALPSARIVCFGDSLTYGYGLKRDETYPSRLAELG